MRNIGVRDAPCWEPNVLNASLQIVTVVSARTERLSPNGTMKNVYTNVTLESERVPECHKLQDRPRN